MFWSTVSVLKLIWLLAAGSSTLSDSSNSNRKGSYAGICIFFGIGTFVYAVHICCRLCYGYFPNCLNAENGRLYKAVYVELWETTHSVLQFSVFYLNGF